MLIFLHCFLINLTSPSFFKLHSFSSCPGVAKHLEILFCHSAGQLTKAFANLLYLGCLIFYRWMDNSPTPTQQASHALMPKAHLVPLGQASHACSAGMGPTPQHHDLYRWQCHSKSRQLSNKTYTVTSY